MTTENAAGRMIGDAGWEKTLPWMALFVRLAIGLAMVDVGLASVMSASRPGPMGGIFGTTAPAYGSTIFVGPGGPAPGWPPPGYTPTSAPPGFEAIFEVLPYAVLALGVGLVFGIFTTISALLTCGMMVVIPLALTIQSITRAGVGLGFGPFGPRSVLSILGDQPPSLTITMGLAAVPALIILVLLSSVSINRISVDSLIFGRLTLPPTPPPRATTEAPRPETTAAPSA